MSCLDHHHSTLTPSYSNLKYNGLCFLVSSACSSSFVLPFYQIAFANSNTSKVVASRQYHFKNISYLCTIHALRWGKCWLQCNIKSSHPNRSLRFMWTLKVFLIYSLQQNFWACTADSIEAQAFVAFLYTFPINKFIYTGRFSHICTAVEDRLNTNQRLPPLHLGYHIPEKIPKHRIGNNSTPRHT